MSLNNVIETTKCFLYTIYFMYSVKINFYFIFQDDNRNREKSIWFMLQ